MSLFEELEKEVSDQANQMAVEVVLLLIDKWEEEFQRDLRMGKLSIPDLLNHYVRLKISLHHVRKALDRGWSMLSDEQLQARINDLGYKVKEARRNYYVTKQRYDESDEHGSECSCRGCRCIKGIPSGSALAAGQNAY